jgi:hypothetical protein
MDVSGANPTITSVNASVVKKITAQPMAWRIFRLKIIFR